MNDETFALTKNRIDQLIERIRYELGLNTYILNVCYERTAVCGTNNGQVVMDVSSSWEYREITITVYMEACVDLPDDRLETVVWHEFMHVMVQPMRAEEPSEHQRIMEERVCTDLAQAFFFTVKERRDAWEHDLELERRRRARDEKKAAREAKKLLVAPPIPLSEVA